MEGMLYNGKLGHFALHYLNSFGALCVCVCPTIGAKLCDFSTVYSGFNDSLHKQMGCDEILSLLAV
jgi:hypothetical protein